MTGDGLPAYACLVAGETRRTRPSHDRRRLAACIVVFYSLVAVLVLLSVLALVWGYPLVAGLVLVGGGVGLALLWGFHLEDVRRWCIGHGRDEKPAE
ncbi:MAG TPA: hypothetical protein VJQ83_00125 [Tepidiformaceae bacterium]|nr:hypothetical protein [Tepidiformaceae bacterium]